MAKLTSDLQDLRKKDVKALESLVLEIRENQFKNRMKHKTGQLTESHLLTVDRKKIAQIKTIINISTSGTNAVTITPSNLRGHSAVILNAPGESVSLIFKNSNWNIIAGHGFGTA